MIKPTCFDPIDGSTNSVRTVTATPDMKLEPEDTHQSITSSTAPYIFHVRGRDTSAYICVEGGARQYVLDKPASAGFTTFLRIKLYEDIPN